MTNNNITNNQRGWQDKAKIAKQLQDLITEYGIRKSKFIKFVPTEKELKEAMRFYTLILELYEEGNSDAIKLKEILDSISIIPEEQIKFTGFLDEILRNYPTGEVPNESLMNSAEKWDVLEYIVEDIIRFLGIKLKKIK